MNQHITGAVIKNLREKNNLTQSSLAEKLGVSDKTVSKWETGRGYPDISLLEPIADVFGVSACELLSGNAINNVNISANMLRSKFYICPVCGNIIHSMGEAVIYCHGVALIPQQAEESDEEHKVFIGRVEDDYFVRIEHDMTKSHYISFVAALYSDRVQMVKLYPEGEAEARFEMRGAKKILYYCNRDGLFSVNVIKGIDDRELSYDDSDERRELEATAKRIFG